MKTNSQFYEYTARTLQGKEISMKEYQGKMVLVVCKFGFARIGGYIFQVIGGDILSI